MQNTSRYKVYLNISLVVGDILLINTLYWVLLALFDVKDGFSQLHILPIFINLGYILSLGIVKVNMDTVRLKIRNIFKQNIYRSVITILIVFCCLFLSKTSENIFGAFISTFTASAFFMLFFSHWVLRNLMRSVFQKDKYIEKAIIIGTDIIGRKIYTELENNISLGVHPLGFFDDNLNNGDGCKVIGTLAEVKEFVLANKISRIYCSLSLASRDIILDFIDFAEQHIINFFIVPQIGYYINTPVVLNTVGSMPVFSIRETPLSIVSNAFIKRTFDLVFSFIFLLTLFPIVYIVVGAAIKLSSPGPIFFTQKRTGKQGKTFKCLKFRSMRINNEADTKQATTNDPRTTRVGRFIRRTNIDELPQFINVFMNDMSVVGPRPHPTHLTDKYSCIINKYMVRHFIKPGVTGWAQINGFRGETKLVEEMEGRIKKDIWYLENWSLLLDLEIVIKTVFKTIEGDKKAY